MRSSGVLMHISSLPSPYGIGTMGKEARKFVDFLDKSGQKYWQILPICPTSYGDSPYQSFSSFAGNPYFIDLEILCRGKTVKKSRVRIFSMGQQSSLCRLWGYVQFPLCITEKSLCTFHEKTAGGFCIFL